MERLINTGVRQHRFAKGIEIPVPQEGMEIVKFHGQPREIVARAEGEPINKAGFTPRQEIELVKMEADRLSAIRQAFAEESQG